MPIEKHNIEILYPELSYTLTGLCFRVQDKLGRFAKEKQYSDLLETELHEHAIPYTREFTVQNTGNRVDFIIDDKVVVEVKAKPFITKDEYYQTKRYLEILNLRLGLLINFQSKYIKPQRVLRAIKSFESHS